MRDRVPELTRAAPSVDLAEADDGAPEFDVWHDCNDGSEATEAVRPQLPPHMPLERIETPDMFEVPAMLSFHEPRKVAAMRAAVGPSRLPPCVLEDSVFAMDDVHGTLKDLTMREKNTFLELRPPALELKRISTEPARVEPMALAMADEISARQVVSDFLPRQTSDLLSRQTSEVLPRQESKEREPPLSHGALMLDRMQTDDGFEHPQALLPVVSACSSIRGSLVSAAMSGEPMNPMFSASQASSLASITGLGPPPRPPPSLPPPLSFCGAAGSAFPPPVAPPPAPPSFAALEVPLLGSLPPAGYSSPWVPPVANASDMDFQARRRPSVLDVQSHSDGRTVVHWAVDAKKLDSQDKQQVSPQFEIGFCGHEPQTFQLVIYPTVVNDGRRGAGFKKAKGRGRLVLKCQSPELSPNFPLIVFTMSIGKGDMLQPARGPVVHRFAEQSCGGLLKRREEWDFKSGVDETRTVMVNVEMWPQT